MKEPGSPWLAATGTYYFLTPAGTPPEVVQRLQRAITKALDDGAVAQALGTLGVVPTSGTPQEAARTLAGEFDRWSRLVKPEPAK